MIHPFAGLTFWDGGVAPPFVPTPGAADQKLRYMLKFGPRIIILFSLLGL